MSYATAAAFRTALEARLNDAAKTGGPPVGRARKIVAFTRLLARLRAAQPDGWVLKGGFAQMVAEARQKRVDRERRRDELVGEAAEGAADQQTQPSTRPR